MLDTLRRGLLSVLSLVILTMLTVTHTSQAAPITPQLDTYDITTTTDELDAACETGTEADFANNGDGLSLREAICLANQGADGDVINLQAGATYTLTLDVFEIGVLNSAGSLTVEETLIINGNGATIEQTTQDNVLRSAASIIISDLTITGGQSEALGGGLSLYGEGESAVTRVTITGNEATEAGGGLNVANGTVTLTDVYIYDNQGFGGGGIYVSTGLSAGTLEAMRVTVSNNRAVIEEFNNTDGDGGGVYVSGTDSSATFTDSTISYNTAESGGGGIYMNNGTVTLNQSTLVGNTAATNAAIDKPTASFNNTFNMSNSILAGNNGCDAGIDVNFNDYNLFQTSDGCGGQGATDIETSQTLDEILDTTLDDNGGYAPTHDLVEGSAAIDAGTCSGVSDIDQRQVSRPIGAACDIGAVEFFQAGVTFTVDSTADTGDDNTGDLVCDDGSGACTLRAAVEQANAYPDMNTIVLGEGELYEPNEGLTLENRVKINGRGSTVDGSSISGLENNDIFTFTPGSFVALDGLVIQGASFSAIHIEESGDFFIQNTMILDSAIGISFANATTDLYGYIYGVTSNSTINLYQTKVYNSILYQDVGNNVVALESNFTEIFYSNVEGGVPPSIDGGNNMDADPLFTDPANGDYSLQEGSPSLNAGSNSLIGTDLLDRDSDSATWDASPYDVFGAPRIQDGTVDMGAVENTPPTPNEGQPVNLTANYDGAANAIDLTWVDNVDGETYYAVERSEDGGTTWAVLDDRLPANTETYTDSSIVCGVTYTYRVNALVGNGDTPYTNTAEVTTPDCVINEPTNLTATYNTPEHQVELAWEDNTMTESGFILERQKEGAPTWLTLTTVGADVVTYVDETATCDQTYIYRVTAVSDLGVSEPAVSGLVDTTCSIFSDVPSTEQPPFFEQWIEDFYQAGITTGCNGGEEGVDLEYCPTEDVDRGSMAVFLLRTISYPNDYVATGDPNDPFGDVPSTEQPPFFEAWIEDFYALGITTGCNGGTAYVDLLFCPDAPVTRGQMAVFILRALEGENYVPVNDPNDPFVDVPNPNIPPQFEAWIEDFYNRGITTGCNNGVEGQTLEFCPNTVVDRGQMAVFILRAFDNIPDPNDP